MLRATAIPLTAAACLAVGCGSPDADEPADAGARARDVLDSAFAAAGGRETLRGIETLVVQYDFTQYVYGPEGVGTPVPRFAEVVQARDFVNGRHLYEIHGNEPAEFWERVVMTPGESFQTDLLAGTTQRYDVPSAEMALYAETQLRWYVYAPLIEADLAGGALAFDGDTVLDGRPHAIIAYRRTDDVLERLFIDTASWQLTQRYRRTPRPPDGERLLHLAYSEYRPVDGVPFPHVVEVAIGGQAASRYDISGIRVNPMLNEEVFALREPS